MKNQLGQCNDIWKVIDIWKVLNSVLIPKRSQIILLYISLLGRASSFDYSYNFCLWKIFCDSVRIVGIRLRFFTKSVCVHFNFGKKLFFKVVVTHKDVFLVLFFPVHDVWPLVTYFSFIVWHRYSDSTFDLNLSENLDSFPQLKVFNTSLCVMWRVAIYFSSYFPFNEFLL